MTPRRLDVLIVGGGLAGPAAAILLARAGRNVVLLEKESQPQHKVCGEFLSQEALAYLQALGVNVAALGGVAIRDVSIGGVTTPLPFAAMSLTRRTLDEELLRLATEAGATILRGHRVQSLEKVGVAWQATFEDRAPLEAPSAFLATGKHDVRGRARPAGKQNDLVGFKMYFRLAPVQQQQLAGRIELLLYRGGYAGLQPVEDGAANLCCLIERTELQRLGGRWEQLLAAMQQQCPRLRERLHAAEPLLAKPLAISAIPYGYVRRAAQDRLWALGDQAAVIPSFTGDGMSIALHSGTLAAQMYLAGETSASYQLRLHRELAHQVTLATTLSRGLIWPPTRAAFLAAIQLWPGVLALVAHRTRVSPLALNSLSTTAAHS
jgi:flavin-dependent dehydrogenase